MRRFLLFSLLCIAVGLQAQQRNNVTSILEVLDILTGVQNLDVLMLGLYV